MTDAEFLFQESIREKRGMVNGAKHTVGKTRRNGRPKDLDVSEKEYKEKCGQVQKFSLSMPMTLEEFKALPNDLQKEYIRRLLEILHMSPKAIGLMFGIHYTSTLRLIREIGYNYDSYKGKRFSKYHNDWRNFFARDERFAHLMDTFDKAEKPAEESHEEQTVKEQETPEAPVEETTQASAQESVKKTPEIMSMSIRIYADSYDELISQLEIMRGQPILGQTLTIEVVKG